MQTINRAGYGDLTFQKTWVGGNLHIGKLADGSYAHLAGMPVSQRSEIEDVIPKGKDLEEALKWFETKDDVKPRSASSKRIIIEPDGSYSFEDGSPVKTIRELMDALPKGPALDAAVTWFVAKLKGVSEDQITAKELAIAKTKENLEMKFICEICGKSCKTEMALRGHMRVHQKAVAE